MHPVNLKWQKPIIRNPNRLQSLNSQQSQIVHWPTLQSSLIGLGSGALGFTLVLIISIIIICRKCHSKHWPKSNTNPIYKSNYSKQTKSNNISIPTNCNHSNEPLTKDVPTNLCQNCNLTTPKEPINPSWFNSKETKFCQFHKYNQCLNIVCCSESGKALSTLSSIETYPSIHMYSDEPIQSKVVS